MGGQVQFRARDQPGCEQPGQPTINVDLVVDPEVDIVPVTADLPGSQPNQGRKESPGDSSS